MAEHNETGSLAEKLASEYLANAGYVIVYRNWRYYHKEIDIIAEKDNTLIIVEVKSRHSNEVSADELVSMQKLRNLARHSAGRCRSRAGAAGSFPRLRAGPLFRSGSGVRAVRALFRSRYPCQTS